MSKYTIIVLLLFYSLNIMAQDIHFSQFNDLPLAMNPALSGSMDGTFRTGVLYRNQWNSVSVPFESTGLFADFKRSPRILNDQSMGWGIQFLNDRSGSGGLNESIFTINGSFQQYLNSSKNQLISYGISFGGFQKSIDVSAIKFQDQFQIQSLNFGSSSSEENFQNNSLTRFNLATGATYTYYNEYGYQLTTGVSLYNINKPNTSFFGNEDPLSRKFNFHASGIYPLNRRIDIDPSFLYSRQAKNNNFVAGADILYNLGRRTVEKIDLKLGIYGRLKDAMNFTIGMNHDNWNIDIGYDLNLSSLMPVSNSRGAFEISISYVNRMFKGAKNMMYIIPGDRLL